jgi:hypothetical protein
MVCWLQAHLRCKTLLCMGMNVVCSALVRICEAVLSRVILDSTLKPQRACLRVGVVLQHVDVYNRQGGQVNQDDAAFEKARRTGKLGHRSSSFISLVNIRSRSLAHGLALALLLVELR